MIIEKEKNSEYIFGLDILRSFAILFVIFGHTFEHSNLPQWLKQFGTFANIGVELFFVLSGFLIGGIILKLINKDNFKTRKDLMYFWKRRWMRTIPLYVIALLAWLHFDYNGSHPLSFHPEYWLFLQNFAWSIPNDFFTISWSLAVEEHFYLWFPLIFLLMYVFISRKKAFYSAAFILLLVAFSYRLSLPFMDYNEWNWNSRMVVLSRLDAIMFGVLMAYLNFFHNTIWEKLRKLSFLWIILVLLILYWYYSGARGIDTYFVQIFGVTFQGAMLALLLPFFNSIKQTPITFIHNFVVWTSRLAYSLYLGHILVIIFINKMLLTFGLYEYLYPKAYYIYPLYFLCYYLLAFITYKVVERPFLELRDNSLSRNNIIKLIPFILLFCFLISIF